MGTDLSSLVTPMASRWRRGGGSGNDDDSAQSHLARTLLLGVAMGGPVAALLMWLVGGWVPGVSILLITIGAVQGLWRGASELAGLCAGLVLALLVAAPVGRLLEGPLSGLTGSAGLLNRGIATLVAGALIVLACSAVGLLAVKALWNARPQWRGWDRLVGGGLGTLQGVLLALVALWVPGALRPIAQARSQADQQEWVDQGYAPEQARERASPLARRLLSLADDVDDSALGSLARATNPLDQARVLELAQDFIAVTRHEEAMTHLQQSRAWHRMLALPSVQQARQVIEASPDLQGVFEREGISLRSMRELLDSPELLRIMDTTDITQEMGDMHEQLVDAIAEAKAQIR